MGESYQVCLLSRLFLRAQSGFLVRQIRILFLSSLGSGSTQPGAATLPEGSLDIPQISAQPEEAPAAEEDEIPHWTGQR